MAALETETVLAPLDNFSLIRMEGDDAEAFLQGQLSNDIRQAQEGKAQYSTYSTAKGRMLASFLIWRHGGAYYLMVSADIAAAIAKRLSMFILRSKVRATLDDAWSILGLSGPDAALILQPHFNDADKLGDMEQSVREDASLLRLPHGGYLLALRAGCGFEQDISMAENAHGVSATVWGLRDIRAGIAWVTQETQEQFVPQMANMELIGAVNFKKGCYPGQEIVARSQYLGKMKRRMSRVEFFERLSVGSKLFSPQLPEQSIGMLAAACQVGEGRFEGLAVAQSQTWEAGVFGDESHAIALRELELPYSLESVLE
ncbi:CAF17-like 4Fe-4S cluster assembly/insertion protein YgfZ [Chromobacterium alticapitis]|uniref:CAF17-like 4Fe-4S cluster assembly/insertion protein YgfZ n=1 Tax=Chromobacterium alticapitis TaxID=2073169 RepID=UPI001304BD48|nr:folate-binding protein [Chromobacterium alticapitis]